MNAELLHLFINVKVVMFFPGALGTTDSPSPSQDEWLRQFDVSLPGCTLKKQVDILALIKQVSHYVTLHIPCCLF